MKEKSRLENGSQISLKKLKKNQDQKMDLDITSLGTEVFTRDLSFLRLGGSAPAL
jgi:hypothetical protein